ncbi:MAG: FAD-binding protein, partial [Anaerovoracaceae bacterium]
MTPSINATKTPDTATSRRNFLKGTGVALAGAAAFGLAGCAPGASKATTSDQIKWDDEYDVIVVGAGLAGVTAAITVADEGNGATCLVLEKDVTPNGNSPFCAGYQLYVEDPDEAMVYLNELFDDSTPEDVVKAFAMGMGENLSWITGLGAKTEWLNLIKPGTKEEVFNEFPEFPNDNTVGFILFKTEGDQPHHIHSFLLDVMANRKESITYKTSTPLESLVQDPSTKTIKGVVANGKNYKAKRGVIMCTGGFESDPGMLKNYTGVKGYPFAGKANTGDGHRACMKIGADFWHMHSGAQYWLSLRNLENTKFVSTLYSFTTKQHGITVGVNGRRFYQDFDGCNNFSKFVTPDSDPTINVGYRHGTTQFGGAFAHMPLPEKAWFIFDQAALEAGALPKETSTDPVSEGWALSAGSIEELAAKIKVPEQELVKTIAQWNDSVSKGEDLAFYRPASTLTAISAGPYYAMLCVPAMLNTDGGPTRSAQGEILDPDGKPITGLYSAGEFGSIWGNLYQGGGNVGECGAFGR